MVDQHESLAACADNHLHGNSNERNHVWSLLVLIHQSKEGKNGIHEESLCCYDVLQCRFHLGILFGYRACVEPSDVFYHQFKDAEY